jgi:hypothetical protein
MKAWMVVCAVCTVAWSALAQDTEWMLEQSPLVSMVLSKALEKSPSFSARVEISLSGKTNAVASSAVGMIECQNGNIRWEAKLDDIKSPQLSDSARAVVRQINGNQLLLLTLPEQGANYLVLAGSQACLQQALPTLKLAAGKAPATTETVDGRVCLREKLKAVATDGPSGDVLIWRSKELKSVPVQLQLAESGETIKIRIKDIRFGAIVSARFRVPQGLTKYNSVEDLVQSVLISKMKRRMGLE